MKYLIYFLFISMGWFGGMSSAGAQTAHSVINLAQVLRQLKSQTSLPVMFPNQIPVTEANQPLYASATSYGIHPDYQRFWQINVDTTPDCKGMKICNQGSLSAEKARQLNLHYHTLPDNRMHTKERVLLKNQQVAYYTPFHIEAGGVNPTLEWQINNVLYTLSWRIAADPKRQKQILIEMGNAAIPS